MGTDRKNEKPIYKSLNPLKKGYMLIRQLFSLQPYYKITKNYLQNILSVLNIMLVPILMGFSTLDKSEAINKTLYVVFAAKKLANNSQTVNKQL